MTFLVRTFPRFREETTWNAALEPDENMPFDLPYPEKIIDFLVWINDHRTDIEVTVSHHLGLKNSACRLGEVKEWIHGS
jgi:hypothetical protein